MNNDKLDAMKNTSHRWLQRKYPESYQEIKKFLDGYSESTFDREFKQEKRKIGRLNKDISYVGKYKKGALVVWNSYKVHDSDCENSDSENDDGVWTGEYDIRCDVKCKKGFTESGYHTINVIRADIDEVLR